MISRLTNKTRAWNKISNNRLNQILNQAKLKTMLKFCLCSSQGKSSPCPSGSPFVPSTSSSSEASATSEGVGSGHHQRRVFCLGGGSAPGHLGLSSGGLSPPSHTASTNPPKLAIGECGQYATSLLRSVFRNEFVKI